ncbi:MAG TPA: DUF2807 domain-containing protein [Magnetospirillaceae bacterium]|nr:DUF2807 domain-containing protein [Magnetospirillaceae bacterium]
MRHWQSWGAAILLVSAVSSVQAAEKSWVVQGNSLKIATPCAKTVEIQPGGEARQIKVSASADHGEEIDQLKINSGEPATIDVGGARCWLSGLLYEKPTLALTIKVPDGTALEISDGGVAHYSIGAVGGNLVLAFSGAGGVKAANAKDLSLSLSGAGDAQIGEVDGRLRARISGAGDLSIDHLRAPATELDLSGKGSVKAADGDAGTLAAKVSGAGNLALPSTSTARLSASGSGDIAVASVKGVFDAKLSGAGNLKVDAIETSAANIQTSGHSEVRLGAGSIGAFSLSSAGASNLDILATVTDANISMVGAGEVRIAKLTGHVSQSVTGAGRVVIGSH